MLILNFVKDELESFYGREIMVIGKFKVLVEFLCVIIEMSCFCFSQIMLEEIIFKTFQN